MLFSRPMRFPSFTASYAGYLAIMYLNGQGVAPDPKEARRWLKSAAEQGVAQAQYRLGQLYAKGQGVPKDMEIACAWFGVAAHLGNTQAATEKKTAAGALSGDALRKAESSPPTTSIATASRQANASSRCTVG